MISLINVTDPFCQKTCKDVNLEAFCPVVDGNAENVELIMISEALPKKSQDYFYNGNSASFFQTTQTAFADAGFEIKHPSEFIQNGIYLTTAIKCTKKNYLVSADTIKNCSFSLEKELEVFKNVRVIMCMGDFAIKAVNYIFKRKFGVRVIPAGSTYRIRNQEYIHNGIRFYPSYTQTGDSFNIEKSKRTMIAEDIKSAIDYLNRDIM
ncbi:MULTISPECIES: uracil-DNA glycosylase family protein [Paenibacillus]|uniref:uracil-DNA glycosylase family protein n=1 Tax=Paenibacillus TaxID=44249 RepID=UPI00203D27BF|nr:MULTISPECIES: uracil-DNA glycosylase family protein [Paenibacillus]